MSDAIVDSAVAASTASAKRLCVRDWERTRDSERRWEAARGGRVALTARSRAARKRGLQRQHERAPRVLLAACTVWRPAEHPPEPLYGAPVRRR
eukprot:scaffold1672_cov366-Prasinococcus_capsulatus_cf.AAC.11